MAVVQLFTKTGASSRCSTESIICLMRSLTAYSNGLVLPHLDYADIVWGDQSNNKDETVAIIPKLHCKEDCKEKSDISCGPLHHCVGCHYMQGLLVSVCWGVLVICAFQGVLVIGEIQEHFNVFRSTQHSYNTRNSHKPKIRKLVMEWGRLKQNIF